MAYGNLNCYGCIKVQPGNNQHYLPITSPFVLAHLYPETYLYSLWFFTMLKVVATIPDIAVLHSGIDFMQGWRRSAQFNRFQQNIRDISLTLSDSVSGNTTLSANISFQIHRKVSNHVSGGS